MHEGVDCRLGHVLLDCGTPTLSPIGLGPGTILDCIPTFALPAMRKPPGENNSKGCALDRTMGEASLRDVKVAGSKEAAGIKSCAHPNCRKPGLIRFEYEA